MRVRKAPRGTVCPSFRDRPPSAVTEGRASLARVRAPVRLNINLLIFNVRTITREDLFFVCLLLIGQVNNHLFFSAHRQLVEGATELYHLEPCGSAYLVAIVPNS